MRVLIVRIEFDNVAKKRCLLGCVDFLAGKKFIDDLHAKAAGFILLAKAPSLVSGLTRKLQTREERLAEHGIEIAKHGWAKVLQSCGTSLLHAQNVDRGTMEFEGD